MNILLIDNGTIHLSNLQKLLSSHQVTTIDFGNLKEIDPDQLDLIVLSGSSHNSVQGNEKLYKDEIKLVKTIQRPIVGICLGFELICFAFGASLTRLENKEKGIINIQISKPDGIFDGFSNFSVYESHRWVIKEAPDCLVELARSKDGIEAVKHKDKNIYGFQFHPEMFVEKTYGDEVFNNLLGIL